MGFLSNLGKGVRKAATTGGVKSKEVVDVQVIRRRIATLEKDKSRLLQELGEAVCDMSERGQLDEEAMKSKCSAIADLRGQIKEHEEQIEDVHRKARETLERIGKEEAAAESEGGE